MCGSSLLLRARGALTALRPSPPPPPPHPPITLRLLSNRPSPRHRAPAHAGAMDAAAAAAAAARALPGVSLLVTSPPPAGPLAAAALCVLLAFTLKFLWGVRKFERMALPSPPIGSFLTGHVDVMLTDTSPLRVGTFGG